MYFIKLTLVILLFNKCFLSLSSLSQSFQVHQNTSCMRNKTELLQPHSHSRPQLHLANE